jgi:hypothetical protein
MQAHTAVDLHDAVSLGLRAHVDARLRENPASIDSLCDQWQQAREIVATRQGRAPGFVKPYSRARTS